MQLIKINNKPRENYSVFVIECEVVWQLFRMAQECGGGVEVGRGWGGGAARQGRFHNKSSHRFCDRAIAVVWVWFLPVKTDIKLQFLSIAMLGTGALRRDGYLTWEIDFSLLRSRW